MLQLKASALFKPHNKTDSFEKKNAILNMQFASELVQYWLR